MSLVASMVLLFALLAVITVAPLALLYAGAAALDGRRRAELDSALDLLAGELGLTVIDEPPAKHLGGRVEGFQTFLGYDSAGELRIEMQGAPHGVRLHKEAHPGRDVAVGDRAFDQEVFVKGDRPKVSALLDARTREVVRELVHRHAFSLDPRGFVLLTTSAQTARADLARAADLVRALRGEGASEFDRLARIARTDPIPRVREKALRALVAGFRRQSAQVLGQALTDSNTKVRLVAASSLGDVAVMSEVAVHPETRAAERRYAVRALGQHCHRKGHAERDASTAFRYALRHGTSTVVREACKYIARLRFEAMRPHLHTALVRRSGVHKWAELTASQRARRRPVVGALLDAMMALGPLGASQDAVVGLLQPSDPELQRIAIAALREAGDVGAVEALLDLAAAGGMLSDIPKLARQAVLAIQARAGGERGVLQVVELPPDAGQLQVAEPEAAGRLQVVEGVPEG